jgi:hypothetical protein
VPNFVLVKHVAASKKGRRFDKGNNASRGITSSPAKTEHLMPVSLRVYLQKYYTDFGHILYLKV